jgi:uncharacterized SAM-binding protein YcdF (DUF218 family)
MPFPRTSLRTKLALLLSAVVFAWLVFPAFLILHDARIDAARPSDCIIVLGAAAYHTRPSPVFEERIRHAISLYQRGLASTIVFTGGYGAGAAHAESEVARNYAIKAGVPASAILVEAVSRTTVENLREAAALMRRHGMASAIIVSDPWHLRRAAMIARDAGIDAVTSPTPSTRFRSWHSRLSFLARETYFYHYYLLLGA